MASASSHMYSNHVFPILSQALVRLVLSTLLTFAEYAYVRTVLWPPTTHTLFTPLGRGFALGVVFGISHAFNHYIVYEVLLSLNHMLSEFIVFIAIEILSYYQAPHLAFTFSTVLQMFGFFVLVFYGDFETPLKMHIKMKSSCRTLSFLVKGLKMKYFECSNPIEKRVIRTEHFLTTGTRLYTKCFTLDSVEGLDRFRLRDKVEKFPVGPWHTLFTIEGVEASILVKTSSQVDKQKELLEYIAHHPEACFVKEVHGSRGKYWPIEEYPKLLTQEIFVCRFPPTPHMSSHQGELDGLYMF